MRPTFDHDEARRLYATGDYTQTALALRFGVTAVRINQIIDPARNQRTNARSTAWTRAHYHKPCASCGVTIWKRGNAKNQTGLCARCWGLTQRTAAHGTESKYKQGCRCDDCRTAMNAARAVRRKRPNVAVHGSHASYSNGCRCDDCRAAHTAYCRVQRASKVAA